MIVIENAIFAELGLTQLVNNNLVHITVDESTQDERLATRKSQKIDLLKKNQLPKDKKYQLIQDKIKKHSY
jgi:dephospho-CoA kinase